MKILIIGTAYPYRGGLAAYNERLAKQFVDEGNQVDIFTFILQYPRLLFPGKTQYTDNPAPENIRISRAVSSINPFNWIRTGLRIRRSGPDIILIKYWTPFMSPCFGTIARIAKRKSKGKTKIICIFDNVIPHEKSIIDKLLTKYFSGCIDGAVVMSRSVGEDLKMFRSDIPVILNPHPLFDNYGPSIPRKEALKKLDLPEESEYLLFFGFIRAYKGLDLLLDAFADTRLRGRKLKLIVAGEFYEDKSPYLKQIEKHKLKDEVILCDRFIREQEVSLFFSACDMVVQPYRSASQSGVTQIAYHFEKPMLVTDVGGLSEIVSDGRCGYVVKPEPGAVADAIHDFFANARKDIFNEGVKKEKAKFTWDKMTESIGRIYDEI